MPNQPSIIDRTSGVDQQMAGLAMKLGGIPVVWGVIMAQMLLWAKESGVGRPPDRSGSGPPVQLSPRPPGLA